MDVAWSSWSTRTTHMAELKLYDWGEFLMSSTYVGMKNQFHLRILMAMSSYGKN